MNWWRPFAIRLAALPLIFLVASFSSYFIVFGPLAGDPVENCERSTLFIDPPPNPCQVIADAYGYEKPLFRGYAEWLGDAVRGDLGPARFTPDGDPVEIREEFLDRAPRTLQFIAIALGFCAVVVVALRGHRSSGAWSANVTRVGALLFAAAPLFLLFALFDVVSRDLFDLKEPFLGQRSFFDDRSLYARTVIAPAAIVGFGVAFALMRAADEPPDRRSKLMRGLPVLLIGSMLAELVFRVPGLGAWLLASARYYDLFAFHAALTTALFAVGVGALIAFPLPVGSSPGCAARSIPTTGRVGLAAGAALVALFAATAVISQIWTPYDPRDLNVDHRFEGPSPDFPLGTNQLGQDVLSQSLDGAWYTFRFAVTVTAIGVVAGAVGAIVVRRFARRVTGFIDGAATVWLAVPWLALVIGYIMSRYPADWWRTVIAASTFVSAHALLSILNRQPDPQESTAAIAKRLTVLAIEGAAFGVAVHATLQFIGFGPDVLPQSTWGASIDRGRDQYLEARHVLLAPAAALTITLLGLHLLAESLRGAIRDHPGDAASAAATDAPASAGG